MNVIKKIGASLVLAGLSFAAPSTALACGTDTYMGTICTFGNNFCPRGTLEANGQIISIASNSALFSLLGTNYGGNGTTTFALPDLRGRSVVGDGAGPGLSTMVLGERAGTENVTITTSQMPAHTHGATLRGSSANPSASSPQGNLIAKQPDTSTFAEGGADVNMGSSAISVSPSGGNQPIGIRNPYLAMKVCIVSEGIYPSRP